MIIYKATNLVNSKIYIGQTINTLELRLKQHYKEMKYKKDNNLFHNALRKYSIFQWKWEIIDSATTLEELNIKEMYWIEFYNSTDKNIGYNLKHGGNNGGKNSNSTKLLIGIKSKERWLNPDIANKMKNGLKLASESWIAKSKNYYENRTCEYCGISFKVKPYNKQRFCCKKCKILSGYYKNGLNEAAKVNIEINQQIKEERYNKIISWIKSNKSILVDVQWNNLYFLKDLLNICCIKDYRTLCNVLNCSNRKDFVKELIKISENIC